MMKRLVALKRIYILILIPISLLLIFLAKKSSFFAEEIYAKYIYRWISQILSNITGVLPFSLAEIIIFVAPVLFLVLFSYFITQLIVVKEKRALRFVKGILNILCVVSIVLFSYTLFAGINYYRYPFSYYSNLTVRDSSVEELVALTESLANQANELRAQVTNTDENGVFQLSQSKTQLGKDANKAYRELSKEYPVLSGYYGTPKPVLLSKLMSKAEITGLFFPFTMETNVNVHVPDFVIPSTMLHELAHLRGFMREDEANYLAYLAGMESDNVDIRYSSTMLALVTSGNALYKQSSQEYTRIKSMYSEGVLNDLYMSINYWKDYEDTAVSTFSSNMNNLYLKANNQSDGIKSYGRMLDLLLAKYRKDSQT